MWNELKERWRKQSPGGYRETLRVAYPLIISTGSFTVMQFCDRMFLAWYSSSAIKAALPAGILSFTFICGFMALAGYANTFVAQYHGAGDRLGCSRATAQGVILSLLSWPLMLLLMPVGFWILKLSGHAPDVLADELIYFKILMWGSVTVPLGSAIGSFFTGRGDTFTNMIATIVANVVNIVLDYALIFGRWGFPEMGIAGAAWATIVSGLVTPAILFALYFCQQKLVAEYDTWKTFRWDGALLWRMVRFGAPSAVHLLLDISSFTLFVLWVGRMGGTEQAASNIALSINNLAFMPLIGMSIAASILVGQYQGRRDSATAERASWSALKIGWIYMLIVALTFILFPRAYFSLFTDRSASGVLLADILPMGRYLLLMMAVWGLMDAANLILSGALKGAGDTRFVMYYSVAMNWCFWITGEALIIFVFDGGLLAAWSWLTAYVMLTAFGFFWRFRGGRWKTIDLLERETPRQPSAGPGAEACILGE
ncbi:MAG TPA: MATE family efflux transporter [Verrucomicrobia bacterium]|nr:MAG: hypothetical protein A2X46_17260 [Lentisphaerae bacterium GWF2_57_35]HBA84450.1 MATE family efflux transporter [Verrucomicrobiota bacterium]